VVVGTIFGIDVECNRVASADRIEPDAALEARAGRLAEQAEHLDLLHEVVVSHVTHDDDQQIRLRETACVPLHEVRRRERGDGLRSAARFRGEGMSGEYDAVADLFQIGVGIVIPLTSGA